MEYLLGAAAGVLIIPAIFALATSPIFALFLVLLAQNLRALGLGQLSIPIGQVDITFLDVVYVLLFLAVLVRIAFRGTINIFEFGWLIVGVLGGIAFTRGIEVYGLVLAGDVRPTFYFTTAILYFASVASNRNFLNNVAKLWIANAVFLSLLAIVLISTTGFIASTDEVAGLSRRPLHATFAFQILQGAIISLYLWAKPSADRNWHYLGLLMVPAIVIMQFRSVWVAAIFALILILMYEKRLRGPVTMGLSVILLLGSVLITGLLSGGQEHYTASFAEVTSEVFGAKESTFVWRILGWQSLFNYPWSLDLDALIGPPAGTARALRESSFILAHTHSQYLLFLLRLGIVGFLIFCVTYFVAISRLRRSPPPESGEMLSGRLLFVLLVTQLIFYIPYNVSYEQFALLGVAIGYFTRNRNASPHKAVANRPIGIGIQRPPMQYLPTMRPVQQ